ncbi:DUF3267 domain-containing protein [Aquibacillus sediminis]|uniref:DUF3267 domain-containing protein n=1 Tax=Aquibacillus sediminis TaxID=2574734 RepID=UPI001FE6417C|nr:DUF3267 domain-containing protein [Aquibacillus sediminis]
MNCWKTINLTREFGINRIYLISSILGLLSFVFLYLPFSIIHQSAELKDHGLLPLLVGLILLPMIHKLMHILPLILAHKSIKLKCQMSKGIFPILTILKKTKMSKKTSIFTLLGPTLFITVPGLISSYLFVEYYAYFILFISVNIGLSFTDFIYIGKLCKAPKKCVIENAKDGYDILVK